MHTDTTTLATPEMLEQLADDHAASGLALSSATFREMAASWKATLRELDQTQAENTRLAQVLDRAHHTAARLEDLAAATANALASIRPPRAPANDDHATKVPA